jgi:23S rRNA pseudouridine1911/1915/1917 synthase
LEIKLKIVYEDESIIIFDKPQGIPSTAGKIGSFIEIVFKHYPQLKFVNGYKKNEGGLLNRLDNETGGIIMFAKTDKSFSYYSSLMKNNRIKKIYLAMVDGIPASENGVIDVPIAHHYSDKKRMTVANNSKYRGRPRQALTHWRLIKTFGKRSYLEVMIQKGARHQIRVHLAYIGLPITGDKLYNRRKTSEFSFHQLYAYKIEFMSFFYKKIKLAIDVPFYYNN